MNVNSIVENITRIKIRITINVDASVRTPKNVVLEKKVYISNPATCSCKNGKYLASMIDDSVIKCDDILNKTEIFNQKVIAQKTKNFSP